MIGVDWGTSSFRAYRIAPDGTVTDRLERPDGILAIPTGGFSAALEAAIAPWLVAGETLVVGSGMVGSRQGWQEVPYLRCPASAAEIAAACRPVPFGPARCLLVPGLRDADAVGVPDVMRGEETQILGVPEALGPRRAIVCLPGTHSKWAAIEDGRILGFATHMTGEVFAAVSNHTILARSIAAGPTQPAAFDAGIARSADRAGLLHHLFGLRTRALFDELPAEAAGSYLSGLLIGHELRHATTTLPADAVVHLIGAEALCALYARGLKSLGIASLIAVPDAAARGLAWIGRIFRRIEP